MDHSVMPGAGRVRGVRLVVAAAWVVLGSGCGSLIPVVKVAPPPSATDAELNKGTTDCAKGTPAAGTASGSTANANCQPKDAKK